MNEVVEVLETAAELLMEPGKWIKGEHQEFEWVTHENDEVEFVINGYCTIGAVDMAIEKIRLRYPDWGFRMQVIDLLNEAAIESGAEENCEIYPIASFNDAEETTLEDVLLCVKKAIYSAENE